MSTTLLLAIVAYHLTHTAPVIFHELKSAIGKRMMENIQVNEKINYD